MRWLLPGAPLQGGSQRHLKALPVLVAKVTVLPVGRGGSPRSAWTLEWGLMSVLTIGRSPLRQALEEPVLGSSLV